MQGPVRGWGASLYTGSAPGEDHITWHVDPVSPSIASSGHVESSLLCLPAGCALESNEICACAYVNRRGPSQHDAGVQTDCNIGFDRSHGTFETLFSVALIPLRPGN